MRRLSLAFTALLDRVRRYTDHPDPLAKIANTVALVVASNQPFYPLYLYAIVSKQAWPAWLTLLTTPLFLAVPALARRHSLAGRAMLPIVGVLNTVLCIKLIGLSTAVELFLLPCILLAAILFRTTERIAMIPVLLMPFAAYFLIDGRLGPPLQNFDAASYPSIIALHAVSVASLTALIGFLFASMVSERRI
jgi:hypothetical protein